MSSDRNQLAQMYTPIYDKFMTDAMKQYAQVMPEVYEVITDETKAYIVDDLSGLGMWDSVEEGEGGNYEDPVLGYPKTFTHSKFIKKFQVTFEAIDDDEYALLSKTGQAAQMGIGGVARQEQDAANIFSGGFATAGPDGKYIFDTDHPKNREETGTLYNNLLSGAFSHDNLEAAETQITANMFTMAGIPIPINEDPILLHPPALRGAVARVLSERANERPTTTMRDINRFAKGKAWAWNYKPVEWIYLNSAMGGSNTAWYIVFKSLGYFKFVWRQKPHFTMWTDEENEFYLYKGRQRYSLGNSNWRGAFGSTGL